METTLMDRNTDKIAKLQTMIKAVDHFRTLDPELPPQIITLLLHIAINPGLTMTALAQRVGVSLAAISRHVERLGHTWGPGRKGMGLVEVHENPYNRRERLIKLLPKGELFFKTLLDVLD